MKLSIEIMPNQSPPRFRWWQVIDTPNGKQTVLHEECVSPILERALERLVTTATSLLSENAALHQQINGLRDELIKRHDAERLGEQEQPVVTVSAGAAAVVNQPKRGRR